MKKKGIVSFMGGFSQNPPSNVPRQRNRNRNQNPARYQNNVALPFLGLIRGVLQFDSLAVHNMILKMDYQNCLKYYRLFHNPNDPVLVSFFKNLLMCNFINAVTTQNVQLAEKYRKEVLTIDPLFNDKEYSKQMRERVDLQKIKRPLFAESFELLQKIEQVSTRIKKHQQRKSPQLASRKRKFDNISNVSTGPLMHPKKRKVIDILDKKVKNFQKRHGKMVKGIKVIFLNDSNENSVVDVLSKFPFVKIPNKIIVEKKRIINVNDKFQNANQDEKLISAYIKSITEFRDSKSNKKNKNEKNVLNLFIDYLVGCMIEIYSKQYTANKEKINEKFSKLLKTIYKRIKPLESRFVYHQNFFTVTNYLNEKHYPEQNNVFLIYSCKNFYQYINTTLKFNQNYSTLCKIFSNESLSDMEMVNLIEDSTEKIDELGGKSKNTRSIGEKSTVLIDDSKNVIVERKEIEVIEISDDENDNQGKKREKQLKQPITINEEKEEEYPNVALKQPITIIDEEEKEEEESNITLTIQKEYSIPVHPVKTTIQPYPTFVNQIPRDFSEDDDSDDAENMENQRKGREKEIELIEIDSD